MFTSMEEKKRKKLSYSHSQRKHAEERVSWDKEVKEGGFRNSLQRRSNTTCVSLKLFVGLFTKLYLFNRQFIRDRFLDQENPCI